MVMSSIIFALQLYFCIFNYLYVFTSWGLAFSTL